MEVAQSRLRKAWEQVCESVTVFFDQFTPLQFAMFKYMITLGFVIVTGVIAWYSVDESSILADHTALILKKSPEENPVVLRWDAQLLGWLSALLYIASRIPQIFKNCHTKCAGLSLALFVFAVGGNVTYVLVREFFLTQSIVLKDHSRGYLIENASWIMGSLGMSVRSYLRHDHPRLHCLGPVHHLRPRTP